MITEAQITAAVIELYGDEVSGNRRKPMQAILEAAEKAAWQPIETAPKDSPIIGWARGCKIFRWDDNRYAKQPRPYWATHSMRSTPDRENQPTHWRPIPNPPTESA